jgi:hypothetical protein
MTLRAWIIELRGRVHEALAPDLAQLRYELAQQRTRMNLMQIQLADQNVRISHLSHLMRESDARLRGLDLATERANAAETKLDALARAHLTRTASSAREIP